MHRLHISILLLFSWFFVFYNVERLFAVINLASFVYLLAPALGMVVLSMPRKLQVGIYWYIPVAIGSVIALRYSLGYPLGGRAFSLMVTEGLATWITIGLSHQLAQRIDEYQSAAATAICSHVAERCRPFAEAQADVIREVRRAREFGRPIAVLALRPQPQDEKQTLDRFTNEFKSRVLKRYIAARTAECLSTQLRQHDILTETDDEFLALLPEMNREEASILGEDLSQNLRQQLGIDLQIGISMFPDDEITAIGLIERAEAQLDSIRAAASMAVENVPDSSAPVPQNYPKPAGDVSDSREVESLA